MAQRPRDDEREARIRDEIIADAYGPEEQASSWHISLDETLSFPFLTRCVAERAISPLQVGDEVEVVGLAPEEECRHELFVTMRWEHRRTLAIPLSQLACSHADDETQQAVEDWQYWVARGYEL
jgi:hypothetical protein